MGLVFGDRAENDSVAIECFSYGSELLEVLRAVGGNLEVFPVRVAASNRKQAEDLLFLQLLKESLGNIGGDLRIRGVVLKLDNRHPADVCNVLGGIAIVALGGRAVRPIEIDGATANE